MMRVQENKKRIPLLSRLAILVLLLLICVSVTALWYESSDAQMRQEQFIQRDESRLMQKPAPAAAPTAPAPPQVIIQQVPVPVPARAPEKDVKEIKSKLKTLAEQPRVSDEELQKLRLAIEELTKQVKDLKSEIKKNQGEKKAPQKN